MRSTSNGYQRLKTTMTVTAFGDATYTFPGKFTGRLIGYHSYVSAGTYTLGITGRTVRSTTISRSLYLKAGLSNTLGTNIVKQSVDEAGAAVVGSYHPIPLIDEEIIVGITAATIGATFEIELLVDINSSMTPL